MINVETVLNESSEADFTLLNDGTEGPAVAN